MTLLNKNGGVYNSVVGSARNAVVYRFHAVLFFVSEVAIFCKDKLKRSGGVARGMLETSRSKVKVIDLPPKRIPLVKLELPVL